MQVRQALAASLNALRPFQWRHSSTRMICLGQRYKQDDTYKSRTQYDVRTLLKTEYPNVCPSKSAIRSLSVVSPEPTSLQIVRRFPTKSLIKSFEEAPYINTIGYNSARDELFYADFANNMLRMIHLRGDDKVHDVHKVHQQEVVRSICHMPVSDTLLLLFYDKTPDEINENNVLWLVSMTRSGDGWREALRVKTDDDAGYRCFTLSDSRVLVGGHYSSKCVLYRIVNGSQISQIATITAPVKYEKMAAAFINEEIVAMICKDDSLRTYRLDERNQLVEIGRIQLKNPADLMWFSGRLLVAESNEVTKSYSISEFAVSGSNLERRRQLTNSCIDMKGWCAVDNGFVIFNYESRELMHYSFL